MDEGMGVDVGMGMGDLDEKGIRWPEKVELKGEAKEVCELKREFDDEVKQRRPLSCRKTREEECRMVVGRIGVGHLGRGRGREGEKGGG